MPPFSVEPPVVVAVFPVVVESVVADIVAVVVPSVVVVETVDLVLVALHKIRVDMIKKMESQPLIRAMPTTISNSNY